MPSTAGGVVTEHEPNFGAEPDDVTVQFYEGADSRTLPVFAVELAEEVTTASVESGRFGFKPVVDDGVGTVVVRPAGSGDGYFVELLVNGEPKDEAELSRTE